MKQSVMVLGSRYISPAVAIELYIKDISVRDNVVVIHKDHSLSSNSDILFTVDSGLFAPESLSYIKTVNCQDINHRAVLIDILCSVDEECYCNVNIPTGSTIG